MRSHLRDFLFFFFCAVTEIAENGYCYDVAILSAKTAIFADWEKGEKLPFGVFSSMCAIFEFKQMSSWA